MADTEYKVTPLAKVYYPASSRAGSHPSPLLRDIFTKAARSQDSVLNGRRLAVSQHPGGCDEWLVDNQATGGGTQTKPDSTTWRVVHRTKFELMPGSVLIARVLAVPSGATEEFVVATATWDNDGNQGAVKFSLSYDNVAADSDSQTVQIELPPSAEDDGVELADAGAAWSQLQHHVVVNVRPSAVANDPAELAKWSEWPTVTCAVEHRGGARVVHASLCEESYEHAIAHDETSTTVNGMKPDQIVTDPYPIEETSDGGSFEDHRFGVHRLLHTANMQTARVGPIIASFSAYSEENTEVTDTETDAIAITSTTPVRVSWRDANANTEWDADAPGFDVVQSRRNPENLSTRLSGAATSPVRIRVYCRFSGAGSATGYFRFQTSPRSWVTLSLSQSTIGTTWGWRTITGFVETNVAGDDAYCIGQDFAWVSAGQLEIRYFNVTYCDYAVA